MHAIWEWVKDEQIELQYISTEEQLADILTKSLKWVSAVKLDWQIL